MIAGTKADTVTAIIEKSSQRNQVTEITLDMAANMGLIAKMFSKCYAVTDRFTLNFIKRIPIPLR
jgi:hypothetical protein